MCCSSSSSTVFVDPTNYETIKICRIECCLKKKIIRKCVSQMLTTMFLNWTISKEYLCWLFFSLIAKKYIFKMKKKLFVCYSLKQCFHLLSNPETLPFWHLHLSILVIIIAIVVVIMVLVVVVDESYFPFRS